jgi:NADH:ubiquinone oxidoreductase subunit E
VVGAQDVYDAIEENLGIKEGETTPDGLFTLEFASCLGVCGVAPAIMINEDVYGNLTPEMIPDILAKYKKA